jgi:hypothetical protein
MRSDVFLSLRGVDAALSSALSVGADAYKLTSAKAVSTPAAKHFRFVFTTAPEFRKSRFSFGGFN